jgi:hypothetical protein
MQNVAMRRVMSTGTVSEPIRRTCHEEAIAVNLGSCEPGRLLRGLSWMNMSSDDVMTECPAGETFLSACPSLSGLKLAYLTRFPTRAGLLSRD